MQLTRGIAGLARVLLAPGLWVRHPDGHRTAGSEGGRHGGMAGEGRGLIGGLRKVHHAGGSAPMLGGRVLEVGHHTATCKEERHRRKTSAPCEAKTVVHHTAT